MRWLMLFGLGWFLATTSASWAQNQSCTPAGSTYELIQRGIFDRGGCTVCHGGDTPADDLDLRPGASYQSLLNHHESGAEADEDDDGDLELVEPFEPESSLLWLTLAARTLGRTGGPGTPMPLAGRALSANELEGVRLWILAGAPADGIVSGVDDLITDDICEAPSGEEDTVNLPTCDANDPTLLLPDLVVDPPTGVSTAYGPDDHRRMKFSTAVGNVGDGPLIIQSAARATQPGQLLDAVQIILRRDGSKCARRAGVIRFGDDGQHWFYAQTVRYELRRDDPIDGDLVALTSKLSYCLLDTNPIDPREFRPHQFEAYCTGTIGRMGISAGYKDVYERVHPGQWVDLDADPDTGIPPGEYYLVNVANPNNAILERQSGREDNLNYSRVRIGLLDRDGPIVAPTPEPTPTPRPTRIVRSPRTPRPRPTRVVHAPSTPRSRPHSPRTPLPRSPRSRPTPRAPHAPHAPNGTSVH